MPLLLFAYACSINPGAPANDGHPAAVSQPDAASYENSDENVYIDHGDRGYLVGMTVEELNSFLISYLERQLENRAGLGADRIASKAPAGSANEISDLYIDREANLITWSYKNAGDYDLNGIVEIADVTPIALNYLAVPASVEENDYLRWLDGSGNGIVGIEDITNIAVNYASRVSSYVILAGHSNDGPFDDAMEIPFDFRLDGAPGVFEAEIPAGSYTHFAVQAVDSGGDRGPRSLAVYLPDIPQEVTAPKIVSVTPSVGYPGSKISFSASVTGTSPVNFEWDFGGLGEPATSTLANPDVTLGTSGSYEVGLTVSNVKGEHELKFDFSTWHSPVADIYASVDKGNPPLVVEFDASGSVSKGNAIVAYEWDFDGDGLYDLIVLGNPKTNYVYETDGWMYPTLRILDDKGQTAEATAEININAMPVVVLEAGPLEGTSPLSVSFDASQSFDPDGEGLSFSWDFNGDGVYDAFTGAVSEAQYLYSLPGDFEVTVKATDDFGASGTASVTVVVSGWRFMTLDSAGIVGEYPSLADISGFPAVSYFKMSDGTLRYIVATEKKGRSWAPPVVVDPSGFAGTFTSLESVAARPAISYWNFQTDDLMFVRALDPVGGAWGAPQTVQSEGSVGTFNRLIIASGKPGVLYKDDTRDQIRFIRALDAEGQSWGSPAAIAPTGSASGSPSITVAAGHPAVSYYDGIDGGLKFVRALNPEGTSWGTPKMIDAFFGSGTYSSMTTINDKPAIAYFDEWNDDLKFVMSFNPLGDDWYPPIIIDSVGDVGFFPSLAVFNGKPAIAYQDRGNSKLKFAGASDSSGFNWDAPETLDHGPNTGFQVSFKVIGGVPCIAYYDGRNLALRFAAWY